MKDRVLCTGVSGFLGGHVAQQLLAAGYAVRGSVRDLAKAGKVHETLRKAGADTADLEIVALDLTKDAGWAEAAAGCDYVVHTASPFVLTMPTNPDDLIRPAVDGTERALKAGLRAKAKRIVLTSSIAAIVYGHEDYSRTYTEADWTNVDGPGVTAYARSKTLAEMAAWSIVDKAKSRDTLAVINPGAILGPLQNDDPGTTGALVVRLLKGSVPAAPRIVLEWVDVRDVAAAHVAALTDASAGGRRNIISGEHLTLMQIALTLGQAFPEYRKKMPRFEMPNWFAWIASLFDASIRDAFSEMGPPKRTNSSRGTALVGRPLIPARDAVIATARTAIAHGLV